VATQTGTTVASGSSASVLVPLTAGTSYHWQVRAVDEAGDVGGWTPFAGNPDPSGIDLRGPTLPSPPPVGGGGGGGGGGCGLTGIEAMVLLGALLLIRKRAA